MKKSVLVTVLLVSLLTITVLAVSYGERIPRIQEFPSEREERALEAKAASQPAVQPLSSNDVKDVQRNVYLLNEQINSLRSTVYDAQAESTNQVNNVLAEIATVKATLEELRDVKRLRDELPELLEQKTAPSPFLLLLTILNFLLLCATIGMLWYMREEKAAVVKSHSHRDLYDYIRKSLRSGVHIRNIKHHLVDHGWDEDEVDKAIHE